MKQNIPSAYNTIKLGVKNKYNLEINTEKKHF